MKKSEVGDVSVDDIMIGLFGRRGSSDTGKLLLDLAESCPACDLESSRSCEFCRGEGEGPTPGARVIVGAFGARVAIDCTCHVCVHIGKDVMSQNASVDAQ